MYKSQFLKLLNNLVDNSVFEKGENVVWVCRNCGHIYIGTNAPTTCPVCAHPQAFFELKANNY